MQSHLPTPIKWFLTCLTVQVQDNICILLFCKKYSQKWPSTSCKSQSFSRLSCHFTSISFYSWKFYNAVSVKNEVCPEDMQPFFEANVLPIPSCYSACHTRVSQRRAYFEQPNCSGPNYVLKRRKKMIAVILALENYVFVVSKLDF